MSKDLDENGLASVVVDAALSVHRAFGPGLLESVYERALCMELQERGVPFERQVPIPVRYKGKELGEGFRADIIVANRLLVELKAVEESPPIHKKQVITYLRLTGLKLGLLVNFGSERISSGITRLVNGLEEA